MVAIWLPRVWPPPSGSCVFWSHSPRSVNDFRSSIFSTSSSNAAMRSSLRLTSNVVVSCVSITSLSLITNLSHLCRGGGGVDVGWGRLRRPPWGEYYPDGGRRKRPPPLQMLY